jgi:hypothetical protein
MRTEPLRLIHQNYAEPSLFALGSFTPEDVLESKGHSKLDEPLARPYLAATVSCCCGGHPAGSASSPRSGGRWTSCVPEVIVTRHET